MGTFNAGSIEADLTLDRSPFNRYLDMARAEARKFDAEKIEPEVDLSVAGALARLRQLQRQAASVDGDTINMQADVDATRAFAQLALLEKIHDKLDGNKIRIPVETDGLIEGNNHFSRFEAIVTAVIALLPLVPPVAATAGAALVGLAAGFTAAAGAAGVIALGVAPVITQMNDLNTEIDKQKDALLKLKPGTDEYRDKQKEIRDLQKQLNDQFGPAAEGMALFQESWAGFQDTIRPASVELVGEFFKTVAIILPRLVPIFNTAAPMLIDMLEGIQRFADSGAGKEVSDFFATFGTDSLQRILDIGGNLLEFFYNLFDAFAPFATTLLQGIQDVTQAWADWADELEGNKGFQDFLDYVYEVGPKVWDLIENIAGAAINIGIALAPIGDLFLDAFNWFFDLIENMDPSILGAIAVGIGLIVAQVLLFQGAMQAFAALAALNPWVLLALAVVALVGVLIYLWNTNEGFRNAIINAWNAIYAAVETVVLWFQNTVIPIFQTVWNGIVTGAMWVWGQVGPIFMGIKDIIVLAWQIVVEIVRWTMAQIMAIVNAIGPPLMAFWNNIKGFLQTVWQVILAQARIIFNSIKTTVQVVWGAISLITSTIWAQIKNIIMTIINVIKGILQAVLSLMRGDVQGAMTAIRGIFTSIWNGIKNSISITMNAILSVIGNILASIQRTVSTIFSNVVRVIATNLRAAKTNVENIINGIRNFFSGAGTWLYNAGVSLIRGLINGIKDMFGQAIATAQNLLGNLRDLLPFSPAKKGPFSGKGWTLYSGRSLVEGLIQGVKDRNWALRKAGEEMLNNLPTEANMTANLAVGRRGLTPADLAAAGSAQTINVNMVVNNPVAERSSETTTLQMTRLAQLGAFSG